VPAPTPKLHSLGTNLWRGWAGRDRPYPRVLRHRTLFPFAFEVPPLMLMRNVGRAQGHRFCGTLSALWLLIFRIASKATHRQDRPIGLSMHDSCPTGAAPSCSDDLVQRNGIIVLASLLPSCATRQGFFDCSNSLEAQDGSNKRASTGVISFNPVIGRCVREIGRCRPRFSLALRAYYPA